MTCDFAPTPMLNYILDYVGIPTAEEIGDFPLEKAVGYYRKPSFDVLQDVLCDLFYKIVPKEEHVDFFQTMQHITYSQVFADEVHKRDKTGPWPHVARSQRMILSAVDRLKRRDLVIIFGPGILEDQLLDRLAKAFKQVILVDGSAVHLRKLCRRPNITTVVSDLTGSFYRITKVSIQMKGSSAEDLLAAMTKEFHSIGVDLEKSFPIKSTPLREKLGEADLVIDSLILSQLTAGLAGYIQQIFISEYGHTRLKPVFMGPINLIEARMMNQHVKDVCSLSKQLCYIADTFSRNFFIEDPITHVRTVDNSIKRRGYNTQMLDADLLKVVAKETRSIDRQEWYWDVASPGFYKKVDEPDLGYGMVVKAEVLEVVALSSEDDSTPAKAVEKKGN